MAAKLTIAVPSKGRLKDQAAELFDRSGLALRKTGHERGYRGALAGLDGVEVIYVSAAEIVHQLKSGRVHLGRHRRGPDPRDARRCRRHGRVLDAAWLRPRRCGGRRSRLLDRRRSHGRLGRCRRAVRPARMGGASAWRPNI